MVDQELITYIKEQLRTGHTEEDIREHLISYGYEIRGVDDAIDKAKGMAPAPVIPLKPTEEKHEALKPEEKPAPVSAQTPAPKHETHEKGQNILLVMLETWFMCLIKPKEVFGLNKGKIKFSDGFMNILSAGVMAGIISSFILLIKIFVKSLEVGAVTFESFTGLLTSLTSINLIFFIPVTAFSAWLFFSGLFYFFALAFGGNGSFKEHSAMLSIMFSPIILLLGVLEAVIPANFMFIIFLVLGALVIYPLIIANKIAHDSDFVTAVLVLVVPIIIILLLLVPAYGSIFEAMKGMVA